MTLLRTWVATPAARALGWTIFHSLWQGAAIALALGIALARLRSSGSRYAASCLAMISMLAAFALTFAWFLTLQPPGVTAFANSGAAHVVHGLPFAPVLQPEWRVTRLLPWLAPFWLAGVVAFHLYTVASWLWARRLGRTGVCSAPDLWQRRLGRLAARVHLSRSVALLESCLADVPVVIGHLHPVILVPLGLLAGLPVGQVEAILLHELAHVRRCDYLVNLLQTAVEGLLFYHPAVWWMTRVIRADRENCCDDLVVATSGDAHAYALALAQLEQNRSAALETALAATGGSLVKRIRRLLHQPEGPRAFLTPVLSAAILALTAALALVAWQTPPVPPRDPGPYSGWLNQDVVYIITDRERAAFEKLQTNEERKHFIEQFWLRRDPTPGTAANEFKQEHYRRIAYANARFAAAAVAGWQTDRGRIYILYGPPDEIESHPYGGPAPQFPPYPFEQWLYRHIQGIGDNVVIDFTDPNGTGDYRMTTDPRAAPSVQVSPERTASISIPLSRFSDHSVHVYGRIVTTSGLVVHAFDARVQAGSTPVYTQSVPLPAGSYRLRVAIQDSTNGATADHTLPFEVK